MLQGSQITMESADGGEVLAKFIDDGAVELYEDGTKRFETTTTGSKVTGDLTVDYAGTATLGGNSLLLKRSTGNTNYINAPLADADLVISADENLLFHTVHTADFNSTERMRLDSSGRLLVGVTASTSLWGVNSQLQVEGTDGETSSFSITRNSNDAGGAYLLLGKSRGTSDGSHTIVQSGDRIGTIAFVPADGTNKGHSNAQIAAEIDGTPGTDDLPSRLQFFTTADGSNSATERMRIDSSGRLLLGRTSAYASVDADNLIVGNEAVNEHQGITILSHSGKYGTIYFGDGVNPDGHSRGQIFYDHPNDMFRFGTAALASRFTLDSDGDGVFVGTVSDSKGNLRSIPRNNQTSAYTLVAADAGKCVTAGGNVTINNSIFASGDAISIINHSGSDITLTQGSSTTIYNTADATTGNRTLASRGMATILFTNHDEAYISGAGLS